MITDIVAAIDIGGTKIALGLASPDGKLLALSRFPTDLEIGPNGILHYALNKLVKMAEDLDGRIVRVGVCCGGPLNRQKGLILSPPNLPGWDEFPILSIVEERLGVQALLDNDANAAALGELHYGAGRGLHNLMYLTISTGIGGGLVVAGQLVHGVNDAAGEVGHITVLPDGPLCGCGARGCLEALCSGSSIARRARQRLFSGTHNSSMSPDNVTAKIVADAARNGDILAGEIWDETIYYLAIGIGAVITILAPEAVILGGGVSMAGNQLLEPLRLQVRKHVNLLPENHINILQASLGGDSGVHGALLLAQRARSLP